MCNSHVDIIPGHVHLQEVGNFVRNAHRGEEGCRFSFVLILQRADRRDLPMGHNGMKYSLPSRELIADCVETMCEAHRFDAMICIPNCDKIVQAYCYMGAMRVNIPTVFVSGGPMEAGKTASGKTVDLIDAFVGGVQRQSGQISAEELDEIEKAACPTCGSCSGMFTANSMNCLAEALGMALPGNGTVLAGLHADRRPYYERCQRAVVALGARVREARAGPRPLAPRGRLARRV